MLKGEALATKTISNTTLVYIIKDKIEILAISIFWCHLHVKRHNLVSVCVQDEKVMGKPMLGPVTNCVLDLFLVVSFGLMLRRHHKLYSVL